VDIVALPAEAGTWGVVHGVGWVAGVIRHATESWAGHAVMYIGGGKIVQATWPRVQIADAPRSNVIWANGQPLTADQRVKITTRAATLVGSRYDIFAYPFLVAALFNAAITQNVDKLFTSDKWRDCSAVVDDCDYYAGIDLFPNRGSNLITPAMLLDLGTQKGWFTSV